MEKLRTYYRIGNWNFDEICRWLSGMARRGLLLQSVKGHRYVFTVSTPCELDYHIEYLSVNIDEALHYTKLCGWKYICSDEYIHFFNCKKGEHYYTGAFYKRAYYTDRAVFYRSLLFSHGLSAAICLVCIGLIYGRLSNTLSYVMITLVSLILIYTLACFAIDLSLLYSVNSRLKALPKQVTPSKTARLTEPDEQYAQSFLEACLSYKAQGAILYDISTLDEATALIKRLRQSAKKVQDSDFMPYYTYWLVDNGQYIGSGNLRVELTPQQRMCGGNIAYEIRPEMRLKGYGKIILDELLNKAADTELKCAVLTCEADNISAVNTVESCGGKLLDVKILQNGGAERPTRIYSVSLASRKNKGEANG